MSKKTSQELLATLRNQMAADVPPVMAKMQAAPTTSPPSPVAKPARAKPATAAATAASSDDASRERTAVSLSSPAVSAMRKIQAMLLGEGSGASASGVISAALQLAAEDLANNKSRLVELYASNEQTDKRRRPLHKV